MRGGSLAQPLGAECDNLLHGSGNFPVGCVCVCTYIRTPLVNFMCGNKMRIVRLMNRAFCYRARLLYYSTPSRARKANVLPLKCVAPYCCVEDAGQVPITVLLRCR